MPVTLRLVMKLLASTIRPCLVTVNCRIRLTTNNEGMRHPCATLCGHSNVLNSMMIIFNCIRQLTICYTNDR